MGASLLAKAVYQQTMMSTDTPYSRAGSLPQVLRQLTGIPDRSAIHLSPATLARHTTPVGSFTWQTPPAHTARHSKVSSNRKRCW
ncbi:hypothetical protein EGJ55_26090 [Pseudomonas moraviensis]|nr:hypothetical protein EGJ55_26090 [Pseudomonas moraviensis]